MGKVYWQSSCCILYCILYLFIEKKEELSSYKNVDQLLNLVQRGNAVYEKG